MAGGVAGVRAEEAPGFAVVANAGGVTVARLLDALVGDPNGGALSGPFDLPVVGTPRQGLLAKHLGQAVKALSAIAV